MRLILALLFGAIMANAIQVQTPYGPTGPLVLNRDGTYTDPASGQQVFQLSNGTLAYMGGTYGGEPTAYFPPPGAPGWDAYLSGLNTWSAANPVNMGSGDSVLGDNFLTRILDNPYGPILTAGAVAGGTALAGNYGYGPMASQDIGLGGAEGIGMGPTPTTVGGYNPNLYASGYGTGMTDVPIGVDTRYGAVDPWMGTAPTVENAGVAAAGDFTPGMYGLPGVAATTGLAGVKDVLTAASAAKGLLSGTNGTSGTPLSRLLGLGQTGADIASVLGNAGSSALGYQAAKNQSDTLAALAREQMANENARYQDLVSRDQSRYQDTVGRYNTEIGKRDTAINQAFNIGAPSRARYEGSYAPGFTMANEPGYADALGQTAKATLAGLSIHGNPADSPNAWLQTLSDVNSKFAYPALQNYRTMNANTGGMQAFGAAGATIPGVNTAVPTGTNSGSSVGYNAGSDALGGSIGSNTQATSALATGLANLTNPAQNFDLNAFLKAIGAKQNNIFSYQ